MFLWFCHVSFKVNLLVSRKFDLVCASLSNHLLSKWSRNVKKKINCIFNFMHFCFPSQFLLFETCFFGDKSLVTVVISILKNGEWCWMFSQKYCLHILTGLTHVKKMHFCYFSLHVTNRLSEKKISPKSYLSLPQCWDKTSPALSEKKLRG